MDIAASSHEIQTHEQVVTDRFYEKFFARRPDIRRMFENADMKHQSIVLRMALLIIEQYYRFRYASAADYLKVLGHRHLRLGIDRSEYSEWRTCLLETLAEFHGSDWHDGLEKEWGEAADAAIERMLEGYALESGGY